MSRKTLLFYAIASSLLGFAARSQNAPEVKISTSTKYVRGIPSGSNDKIELITNPSAKYDSIGVSIIKMNKDEK